MRVFSARVLFQVIGGFLALITGLLTARWLGPEARGILTLVLLIPYVASILASLGINDAAAYVCNRLGVAIKELTPMFILLTVVVGGFVGAGLTLVVLLFGHALWGYHFNAFLAISIGTLFICKLWSLLARGLLMADRRFSDVNWIDFIENVITLIVFIVLTYMFERTVYTATASFLITANVIAIWIIAGTYRYGRRLPDWDRLVEIFRLASAYGLQTQLRSIGVMLMLRADFFLVGSLLGLKALGLYSIANTMAEIVFRIPDAASWLLMPQVTRVSDVEAERLTSRYMRAVLFFTTGIAICVGIVAPYALPLLVGKRFEEVIPVLYPLLIGVVVSSIYKVLGADLIGRGYASSVAISTWLGATAMLLFDIILIPRLGLVGAGIASSIGYGINMLWTMRSYMNATAGTSLTKLFLIKREDFSFIRR